ncbi:hypothetical protein HDZ31DRAFT_76228 [Schizophyllum fasciatum]
MGRFRCPSTTSSLASLASVGSASNLRQSAKRGTGKRAHPYQHHSTRTKPLARQTSSMLHIPGTYPLSPQGSQATIGGAPFAIGGASFATGPSILGASAHHASPGPYSVAGPSSQDAFLPPGSPAKRLRAIARGGRTLADLEAEALEALSAKRKVYLTTLLTGNEEEDNIIRALSQHELRMRYKAYKAHMREQALASTRAMVEKLEAEMKEQARQYQTQLTEAWNSRDMWKAEATQLRKQLQSRGTMDAGLQAENKALGERVAALEMQVKTLKARPVKRVRDERDDEIVLLRAFATYEIRWMQLQNEYTRPNFANSLPIRDFPWPIAQGQYAGEESITKEAIVAYLLHPKRPGGRTARAIVQEEMRRYHSDKFDKLWSSAIVQADRAEACQVAKHVTRLLIEILKACR